MEEPFLPAVLGSDNPVPGDIISFPLISRRLKCLANKMLKIACCVLNESNEGEEDDEDDNTLLDKQCRTNMAEHCRFVL